MGRVSAIERDILVESIDRKPEVTHGLLWQAGFRDWDHDRIMAWRTRDDLRRTLVHAQRCGVIGQFALRQNGRATIHSPDGRRKVYTTSTLDTLTTIDRLEKGEMSWQ